MLASSWSVWRHTLGFSALLAHEAVTLADAELKQGFDNVPTLCRLETIIGSLEGVSEVLGT